MTLVSTKYIGCFTDAVHALEISISANVRHRAQNLGKRSAARSGQGISQYRAMLGLGTPAPCPCTLFESTHQRLVDTTHEKICHHRSLSSSCYQW